MSRFRVVVGLVVFGAALAGFGSTGGTFAQEKKDDPPTKLRGMLPNGWRQLGLSADQVQDIYRVQAKYRAQIDDLEAQIEKLKQQQKLEMFKILSDRQKARLREIATADLPPDESKPKPEKKPEKP